MIRAQDPSLVGARIVSVGGLPAADVEARVRPLVPRDNEWSLLDHLPYFLVTAEVLEGVGVGSAPTWELELRDGTRRRVVLDRISNAEYASTLLDSWWQGSRKAPLFIRLSHVEYGISVIDRGRALYVSYNHVTQPGRVPERLVRLAKRKRVRKIVVELRMNGGGNNTTYYGLVQALRNRRINRPERLAVLIGRRTFSAAGNFAADVDRHDARPLLRRADRRCAEPVGRPLADPAPFARHRVGHGDRVRRRPERHAPRDDAAGPGRDDGRRLVRGARPCPRRGARMSLTTTEAALLGLLRKEPMSGYDLRKDADRSVGYFWAPAKTQIYATLPKLVEAGFATQEKVVQSARPDKTIYAITDEGRDAVREWVEEAPLDAGQGRNLILLKLYLGEGADPEALQRQLGERREDAEQLLVELEELEAAGAGGSEFQALTRRWGVLYAEALLAWTAEASAALKDVQAESGRRSR